MTLEEPNVTRLGLQEKMHLYIMLWENDRIIVAVRGSYVLQCKRNLRKRDNLYKEARRVSGK
jgi:hypothetical protein